MSSSTAAIIGWSLQSFCVPIVFTCIWSRTSPQMLLVMLFAATAAVLAQILPAVVFVVVDAISSAANSGNSVTIDRNNYRSRGFGHSASSSTTTTSQGVLNGLYLFAAFLSIEFFRALICIALVHAELQFRARKGQSLSGSKFGTLLTGFAAGVGYGTMMAVFSVGTALNFATSAGGFGSDGSGVVAFDYFSCPSLVLMESVAISGQFLILSNIAWTAITLQCWTSFIVSKKIREQEKREWEESQVDKKKKLAERNLLEEAANVEKDDNNDHHTGMKKTTTGAAANDHRCDDEGTELQETPRASLSVSSLPQQTEQKVNYQREREEDGEAGGSGKNVVENHEKKESTLGEDTMDNKKEREVGHSSSSSRKSDEKTSLLPSSGGSAEEKAKQTQDEKQKKKQQKGKRPPPPPLPIPDFKKINPSELDVSQAKLFYTAVFVLHFVFRAISLVYYSSAQNATNGNSFNFVPNPVVTETVAAAEQNRFFVKDNDVATAQTTFTTKTIAPTPSSAVVAGTFYSRLSIIPSMDYDGKSAQQQHSTAEYYDDDDPSMVGGDLLLSSDAIARIANNNPFFFPFASAGAVSTVVRGGGGSGSDSRVIGAISRLLSHNIELSSNSVGGGCVVVLPVQGAMTFFALLLGVLVAWTDRR